MEEAVILSAVRTPIGRYGGSLKDVRPDDLAALAIAEAVQRAHIDANSIEDVILGCANQAGEDNRNVARMALLLAGLPKEVAGQTVNRLCGSGLQAVNNAAQAIPINDARALWLLICFILLWGGWRARARPKHLMVAEGCNRPDP